MKYKLRAENNLSPIRRQLLSLLPPGKRVIEFGCGKGELLQFLSPHIRSGWGMDKSYRQIHSAKTTAQQYGLSNLTFSCVELGRDFQVTEKFDYGIANLFFHVIAPSDAVYLLNHLKEVCSDVLVGAFSSPSRLSERIMLWADQRVTGHYFNFKAYQKLGGMEGLLAHTQDVGFTIHDTSIPFVKIYYIPGSQHDGRKA